MATTTGPHAIAARRHRPTADASDADRRLRSAALLHVDGDLTAAEAEYAALLEETPGNPAALNNLGLLRAQRGDVHGALAAYARIGPDASLSATALLNKANALLVLGDTGGACRLLQRAVTLDPDSPAWIALGQAQLLSGDLPAAEAAFRQAHERLPARVDVLRSLASCLAGRGQLEEAAQLLSTAVQLDDQDAATWRQLGAVLLSLRDLGSAAQCTRTASRLDPGHVPTLRQLAVVLLALGRPQEAAEALDRALALDRTVDVLVDRGVLHLAAGDVESARTLLEEGVCADTTGRAELHLGYALLAARSLDEAREHLMHVATQAEPFAARAREALARIGPPPTS